MACSKEPNFEGMPFGVAQIVSMWVEMDADMTRSIHARTEIDGREGYKHAMVASGLTHDEAGDMKRRIWDLVRIAKRLTNGA